MKRDRLDFDGLDFDDPPPDPIPGKTRPRGKTRGNGAGGAPTAGREGSRPLFEVPGKEDELLPVMRALDKSLDVDEPEPPMRSPRGWPVEVRASEPAGMHELTASGANDDEGEADRLPPPKLL